MNKETISSASRNNYFPIILICVICLIYFNWKRRHLYLAAAKVRGPFALPIVGNGLLFLGSIDKILETVLELCAKYKSPFRFWAGSRLYFFITDPKHLEIVLKSPHALNKDYVYRFMEPFLGQGMITSKTHIWKPHRRTIIQSFNKNVLNDFIPIFENNANVLTEVTAKQIGKGIFNAKQAMNKFTLDTVCGTILGVNVSAQKYERVEFVDVLSQAMRLAFSRLTKVWLYPDFIYNLTGLATEFNQIIERANSITMDIIRKNKSNNQQPTQSTTKGKTNKAFLDYILTSNLFTDEEVLHEVNTILAAGNDTTANVLAFSLIMLGMHPEIQNFVYEEIATLNEAKENHPLTNEDLRGLKYTERVIQETLRLFPGAPMIARSVTEDIDLDGLVIPKRAALIIPIICVHRDPVLWPNPLKFDPDRFLPDEVAKRHPFSYIPFSRGPRNCIGIEFAMMVMKIALVKIVSKYRISTDYKTVEDIKVKQEITIEAVNGFRICLEKRN